MDAIGTIHSMRIISGAIDSNNFLIPGTPEYNAVRYPGSHKGEGYPDWMRRLVWQKVQKGLGDWKYKRSGLPEEHFQGTHLAQNVFRRELTECIRAGICYKTKTFEYVASTGELFVTGKLIGKYNFLKGSIDYFTLKHINTKLSRYRLRDFDINLVLIKGITYWKMPASDSFVPYLRIKYPNIQESFKQIFSSVKISEDNSIVCGLRENVCYEVESRNMYITITFPFHTYDCDRREVFTDETRPPILNSIWDNKIVEFTPSNREEVDRFMAELKDLNSDVKVYIGIGHDKIKLIISEILLQVLVHNGTTRSPEYRHRGMDDETVSLYRDDVVGVPFTVTLRENTNE
jgi:hypothetical protein